MRRTKTSFAVLAALLLVAPLAACTTSTGTSAPEDPTTDTFATPEPGIGTDSEAREPAPAQSEPARDVIRTASLTVVVTDPKASGDRITQATKDSGGYVAQVSTANPCEGGVCPPPDAPVTSDSGQEATSPATVLTMTIRVPAAKYDTVLAGIQGLGEVASLSVTADDVTAQAVDLDARIESQRASVVRMRQLLQQATTIAEMVRVEGELAQRQSDLESMISQRKQLADQVALATITVELVPADAADAILPDEEHWWDAPWDAFTASWRNLLVAMAAISPLLILGALAGAIVLVVLRRRRRPEPAAATSVTPPQDAPAQAE